MESRGEACELQQLVSSDVEGEGEGDDVAQESYTASRDEKVTSPGRSIKVPLCHYRSVTVLMPAFTDIVQR